MPGVGRKEGSNGGVFGLALAILFVVFNILMVIWAVALFANLRVVSERSGISGVLTATIGIGRVGLLAVIWLFGDALLGAIILAIRRSRAGAPRPRNLRP